MNYLTVNASVRLLSAMMTTVLLSHYTRAEEANSQHDNSKVSHAKELSQEFRSAAELVSPSVVLVETLRGPRETP